MHRSSRLIVCMLVCLLLAGVVWAEPVQQNNAFRVLILETRADLEDLANTVLGEGVRPETWTFNVNSDSLTFIADLWYDNEQLADIIYGVSTRPPEWIGASSPNAGIIARNVRHDVELAADKFFANLPENRPPDWRGAAPIYRCSRSIQNMVRLLDLLYTIQLRTQPGIADYCGTLAAEINDELTSVVQRTTTINQEIPDLILAVRGDLERLADEKKGLNVRPNNWIRNVDRNSATLAGDIFLDLENLANDQLGQDVRPAGWIGVLTNAPATNFRNLRHDLELLADSTLGAGVRPRGWQGEDPLLRCTPLVQGLVYVVTDNYNFTITDDMLASSDFCSIVEFGANNSAENPPVEELQAAEESRYRGKADWAFSYLDVAALQYMGQMPAGTEFRAWYRNFAGSNMMFVSGNDFAVYIDRRWTDMEREIFETLPVLEDVKPLTFCDARWCNGPGPTPTPTGFGPLQAIVQGATPPAPGGGTAGGLESKTQVSWNAIRVTYLLDKPETKTVQVTLEICAEPAQISCEPVIQVFDNNTGTNKPALSQLNGLNVYEFTYGYIANLIIEGATRYSPDVWISDPTIR